MFFLFVGDYQYPSMGTGDYRRSYETLEEAVKVGKLSVDSSVKSDYNGEWYNVLAVVDSDLKTVAYGSEDYSF